MNKQILKKIKSESGASLVLAMLVFLVCALVGATILSAATSSAGTLTNTWQEEKDVYVLKSAEKLVADSFSTVTWKANIYENEKDDTGKITASTASTSLKDLYNVLCIKTYNNSSAVQSLTLKLGNSSTAVDDVNAEISMDADYNVTAVFSSANMARKVQVFIPASSSTGTTTRDKGAIVTWRQAVVTVQ